MNHLLLRQPSRHLTLLTRHLHSTRILPASPSTYVTGVTSEQIASNPALAEYYAVNFGSDWENAPDIIVKKEKQQEEDEEVAIAQEQVDEHAPVLPPEYVARNIRPLVAYARLPGKEEGSRNCRKMRNPFQTNAPSHDYFPLIPGIVHGSNPQTGVVSVDPSSKVLVKTPWFEIQRELDRYHRDFEKRVYALTIYNADDCDVSYHASKQNIPPPQYKVCQETMTISEIPPPPPPQLKLRTPIIENLLVLPSDLQMHPIDHTAFCLNYIRYHAKKPINLPIRTINEEESPAMKRGGFLAFANRSIPCLVEEGAVIPEFLALECTGLRQKDVVRRGRLVLPEGVRVCDWVGEDYLVGTVFGSKGGGVVEEDSEEKK